MEVNNGCWAGESSQSRNAKPKAKVRDWIAVPLITHKADTASLKQLAIAVRNEVFNKLLLLSGVVAAYMAQYIQVEICNSFLYV